ncbi:SGNH hydrolase [Mycena sp. CBHHK59/15]|nr:SGNH hydrolase [Mycena sp. CBHHK59/15]
MLFYAAACLVFGTFAASASPHSAHQVRIQNDDPLIFFHGRWDKAPGTWWSGSGFKINVQDLSSLTLNLGPNTTAPLVSLGISVDYAPFFTFNATEGANVIPLSSSDVTQKRSGSGTVVRINVENYFNNRMNLESINLNPGARLLPYKPSKLVFEFIGDSFSTGYTTPEGILQAWTFLTGEKFKAEESVVAQPGAALVDIFSFGNAHGMSYQFFRTEDTGYYYTTDHNYTTPWISVEIANDASQNVDAEEFVNTYIDFLGRIRKLYPHQPFFLFTPWGWPNAEFPNAYYYQGKYEEVLAARQTLGDNNMFLVNTTDGNLHPSVSGHAKIAGLFQEWLENWGLHPLKSW